MEDNQAVQDQRLDNHEERIRQLEVTTDNHGRSIVKLEVMMENMGKRWDSLEEKLFVFLNQVNNSSSQNSQEWSAIVKESFKIILILAGAIASVKFFGK